MWPKRGEGALKRNLVLALELAPGPSKATRAYLHKEADVRAALERAGFRVTRDDMTATSFYFSRLLEAERVRS